MSIAKEEASGTKAVSSPCSGAACCARPASHLALVAAEFTSVMYVPSVPGETVRQASRQHEAATAGLNSAGAILVVVLRRNIVFWDFARSHFAFVRVRSILHAADNS